MEKHISGLLILLSALFLLVGGLVGYSVGEAQEVIKEVQIDVPVEVPVEVEVIKEVQIEKDFDAYKAEAVELCLDEFLDDADLDRYQDAEIRDISDEWTIFFDEKRKENRTTITIDEIKFRVFDELDETRQTITKSCKVVYYDDDIKVKLI